MESEIKNLSIINMDAFSDGQMRSKLWLCKELEELLDPSKPHTLWIYGAWYGTLALLLLVRERINIKKIHLFDIDPEAIKVARKVLDSWRINGTIVEFHERDCLSLNPSGAAVDFGGSPDVIINTSCEHFESDEWLKPIPPGTLVVLQSTDMVHPTHIRCPQSIEDFKGQISMSKTIFSGTLSFSYPNFEFKRFMLIGNM